MVRVLLAAGADIDSKNGDDGRTALHYASYRGNTDVVRALLAAGADTASQDERGNTPLHNASSEGNGREVWYLLAAGANPRIKNFRHETPVQVARTNVLKKLYRRHFKKRALKRMFKIPDSVADLIVMFEQWALLGRRYCSRY